MTLKHQLKIYIAKLTLLLSSLTLCLGACTPIAKGEQIDKDLKYKFRGINGVVIDTSSSGRHQFVTITSETGRVIDSPSLLARGGGGRLDFTSTNYPVPKTIHVIWRSENDGKAIMDNGTLRYEGTIIGDYTVPVAERIPDELLDDLRKNRRGNLRIKIRLAEDRVLIGWDIERKGFRECTSSEYEMAAGDFREAEMCNGKVVRKGWYIDKNGQKIETDY